MFISCVYLQYEDEDGDKVVLATDSDLVAAVDHAKLAGWKVILASLFSYSFLNHFFSYMGYQTLKL